MIESKPKVVVLGGGFGGLETAFTLRKQLGEDADITIVTDRDRFLFKPNTIYIPYGLDPDKLTVKLQKPARKKNIDLQIAKAHEVNTDTSEVLADGQRIRYDYLVVATGATMRPGEIEGMEQYAHTIWTPEEMLKLRVAYHRLLEDAREGKRRRVVFVVPPNNKCSGPLYEMVFMLDTWLRRKGVRQLVDITFSTFEASYIQSFGPRLHEFTAGEMRKRGITGYTRYAADHIEDGRVVYQDGIELPFDLLISFPPYAAAQAFPGLPSDERGFIHAELESRRVTGYSNVYVVGDAADFPVKQGFLAFLQGDAAASYIAADIRGEEPETGFDPVSMCVMEEYNQATFAQVPLELTGDPALPVRVRSGANGDYRVGTGKTWRLGKKMIGLYLPWRFRSGEPFHQGVPWKGMEAGLKVMSTVLAK